LGYGRSFPFILSVGHDLILCPAMNGRWRMRRRRCAAKNVQTYGKRDWLMIAAPRRSVKSTKSDSRLQNDLLLGWGADGVSARPVYLPDAICE
jgi:hypothetical protein